MRLALPPPEKPLRPGEVAALRGELDGSQAVFAMWLKAGLTSPVSCEGPGLEFRVYAVRWSHPAGTA